MYIVIKTWVSQRVGLHHAFFVYPYNVFVHNLYAIKKRVHFDFQIDKVIFCGDSSPYEFITLK